MRAIDIHCHMVPEGFPAPPCTCVQDKWPRMDHREKQQAMVMIGKREFRLVDQRAWDVDRRLKDMEQEDVRLQVVSPMPELLGYWIDAESALVLSKHVNETIANMVAKRPDHFRGLGMCPLQDIEMATRELQQIKDMGLSGVEIGSNVNGKSPGDPQFDQFFAEAERLDLSIFVHALHPTNTDRLVGQKRLAAMICFPTDVGMAAASMLTGRTLEKFPKLRIAFSHGGGTLASFLPRLQASWEKVAAVKGDFADPWQAARKMYFDNVVFDPHLLRYLITTFGETQICVGSDYPFRGGQKNSAAFVEALQLPVAARDDILYNNAARFLNLEPAMLAHAGA